MKQTLSHALALAALSQPLTAALDCKAWNTGKYFRNAAVADVRACLEAGAEPNARTVGKARWTPLHRAATYSKYPGVIRALVDAGADLEARNGKTMATPLHEAAEHSKYPGVTKALIDAGADLEARSNCGMGNSWTPLHCAVAAEGNYNRDVIEVLIESGADLDARTGDGFTPLQLSKCCGLIGGNTAARKALLAAGAQKRPMPRRDSGDGSGLAALIAGVAGAAAASAIGLDAETAGQVGATLAGDILAEPSSTSTPGESTDGPAGNAGSATGVGPCLIPNYPNPGDVLSLGLPWCPASVDFQLRSFALYAAGAQCSLAAVPDPTPRMIGQTNRQIADLCGRIDALNARNARLAGGRAPCRCPAGFGVR